MLDALKNLTGGKNKLVQKQTDELELLVASAREERAAISAMLTTLTTRSQKLTPLGKTLEQMTDRVMSVTERLDDIAARLTLIDDRTKALEEVDVRIQGVGTRRRAEATSGSAARAVVAGALYLRDGRDLEERARNTRRGARPAAEG